MARTYSLFAFFILLLVASSCGVENEPDYILTTQAVPEEAGTVIQSAGDNPDSKSIRISAKANEHWEFIGWTGDLSGTNDSTVFVFMDRDREIQAKFEKVDYPVTIHVEGEGNVITEVVSQKTTTEEFQHATVLRLVAEPTPGWRLSEWSGDASGSENEVDVVVDGPVEVTATFERIEYELIIHIEGEGEVTREFILPKTTSSEYPFETMVQLTAEAANGWKLESWSGDVSGSDETVMVEMDGNKEITVRFERIDYNLLIHIEGEGVVNQKLIEGEGVVNQEFVSSKTISSMYPFETMVQLTAIAENGWVLDGWSGDASGSEETVMIEMDGNKEITIRLKPFQYSLNVQINGTGSYETTVLSSLDNNVSTGNQFLFGSIVRVQALPGSGWSFTGWSGDKASSNSAIEILINGNKNLVLDFLPFSPNSRILQLGDSITNGAPYSYRFGLYGLLSEKSLQFQNVGTQVKFTSGSSGQWDADHESYDGAKVDYIEAGLKGWLQTYTADIVLIHLGTNDVIAIAKSGGSQTQMTSSHNNIISIINQLRNDNPNIKIYLAKILPIYVSTIDRDTLNETITLWNSNLESISNNNTTAVSPIKIVDMNSGFSQTDLIDGIHPTQATALEMARRWYNALVSF